MALKEEYAKLWLRRYRMLCFDIARAKERIETLKSRAASPGSPKLDGMPHEERWNGDRLGELIANYTDLENETAQQIKQSRAIYKEIDSYIKRIRCTKWADVKIILQLRYLDCSEWGDIVDFLFIGEEDFFDKEDSYKRRMYNYHGTGIKQIANMLGEKEYQEIVDFYGENLGDFLSDK